MAEELYKKIYDPWRNPLRQPTLQPHMGKTYIRGVVSDMTSAGIRGSINAGERSLSDTGRKVLTSRAAGGGRLSSLCAQRQFDRKRRPFV